MSPPWPRSRSDAGVSGGPGRDSVLIMRIALVHLKHARTGGTERFLNAIAAHLAERDHEVTILCRRHGDPPDPRVRFETLRGFALGAGWRMWTFARAVERHVAAADYDLVVALGKTWTHHVIRCGGGCHRSFLEAAGPRARRAWERALQIGRFKDLASLAIERRAYAPGRRGRVIAVSGLVQRDIARVHGVPPEEITVVHNGVDLEQFHPGLRHSAGGAGAALRSECGWGERERVVLFLGRGFARKGLEPLLRAFPLLLERRPEARLLVVGSDRHERRYRALADSLGLGERARWLGERRIPRSATGQRTLTPSRPATSPSASPCSRPWPPACRS